MRRHVTSFVGFVLLLTAPFGATAWAARQPSAAHVEQMATHFFQRYGKKFPATAFGQHRVTQAQLLDMAEIHKHYLMTTVTLTTADGPQQHVNCAVEKRPLGGWKIVAWELQQ